MYNERGNRMDAIQWQAQKMGEDFVGFLPEATFWINRYSHTTKSLEIFLA